MTLPTAVFIIFGATGNLSTKRIFPALFELSKSNLLPQAFKIFACARSQHTSENFRKIIKSNLKIGSINQESFRNFAKNINYLPTDIAENIGLSELSRKLEQFEKQINVCPKRIFYMAITPQILKVAIKNLGTNKLHSGCQVHNSKPRIVIEKPFGYDLKSAKFLNSQLSQYFSEEQIYRIDHFLGKETVQNIFAFRFANEIFEPIWNNRYIDHVQITASEYVGIEKRGQYYDQTGALRDFTQNHLIQLLALVTMEMPEKFASGDIRNKKLEIIRHIKKLTGSDIQTSTVRGQYQGYRKEENVNTSSDTETYALAKLFIENKRWQGVPFYLRTGKRLTGKVTSIIIQLKEKGHKFFENFWESPLPNHITIQIQPNEGIGIRLAAKKPGLTTTLEPIDMEFCYKHSFDATQPDAYKRLLLDIILGDQTLFISQDIVEESWKIIDPIEQVWQKGKPKLATYKPGTWGPKEADDLIKKDGRVWLAPLLTICKI